MCRVQSSPQYKHFQPLQEKVNQIVEGADAADKINRLLRCICSGGIQRIQITQRAKDVGIEVNLKRSQSKPIEGLQLSRLYIPRVLKFGIHKGGIRFDSETGQNTPYQDISLCCGMIKDRATWWKIKVDEKDFVFESPRWFVVCIPLCGGIPNSFHYRAERFLNTISSQQ